MSGQGEPLLQHVRCLAGAVDPDEQLLADYLARHDEAAFAALVGRHGPMVLELCRRILHDRHAAEDVFQATFLLLAERGEAIRRRTSLASWLHGVAYRLAVRARRRASANRLTGELAGCASAAPATVDTLAWQEVLAVLDEELRNLPDRYRAPLVLCYLQARTQDEAARLLSLSVGTLRRRLEQGRGRLEARLRGRGISLPAALAGLLAAGTAAVPASLRAATVALAGRSVVGTAVSVVARQGGRAMILRSVKVLAILAVCGVGLAAGLWIHGRGGRQRAVEVPLRAAAPATEAPSAGVRLAAEAVEACGSGPHSFAMLLELGVVEAKLGNAAAARKRFQQAADRIAGSDYTRAITLVLVAYRLAEAGDPNAAEGLLAEVRRLAPAIKPLNNRAEVLRFATVCLAEKLDRGKALTWAAKVPEENCRLNAYRDIAVAQAAAGEVAAARRTVELIRTPYGYFKIGPWKAIAAAQLKVGDKAAAEATLRQAVAAVEQMRKEKWGDWRQTQVDILLAYAVAQGRAGDRDGARTTFGRVEKELATGDRPESSTSLAALARAQAEAGERAAAGRTIGRFAKAVQEYEDEKGALAAIIPAQIALGDLHGAARTARQVGNPQTLRQVCEALAQAGRQDTAVALARKEKSAQARAWGLLGAARGAVNRLPSEKLSRYVGTLAPTLAEKSSAPEQPPTRSGPDPAQQMRAGVKKWEQEWAKFNERLDRAKTKEERQKLLENDRPSGEVCARELVELARQHPNKPVALEALGWVLESASESRPAEQALTLLRRDYLATRKVGDLCTLAVYSPHRAAVEALLRAVLEKSPHRAAKGQACIALADFLKDQAQRVRSVQRRAADDLKVFEGVYGPAELKRLRGADPAALQKEAERLYERVLAEFADVFPSRQTQSLGKRARGALDEIRLLAVGQPAPDIKGEDVDGKPLRLSDQRGKVVLLVFWATWCGPCRAMIPHERKLVKRLAGKPFVLLGVNGDSDRAALRRWLLKNPMPWRSWWDDDKKEGDDRGRIARAWNVSTWPTVYVLDARGVIRHRDLFDKDLDGAVDTLLAQAESCKGAQKDGRGRK
jgi:RNA polymerase sigma factor (sigma-70 family)